MVYKNYILLNLIILNFGLIHSMENDKNILDLGVDNKNGYKFEYFTKLPKDMQLEIIKYLSFIDFKNFRLAAKLLKDFVKDEDFIKQRNLAIKLGQELIWSVYQENLFKAKEIINLGDVQINVQDKVGNTALIEASGCGDREIVELLIVKNVNVDLQDRRYGRTALMDASDNLREKIVKLLIDANANLTLKDKNGMTALDLAKEGLKRNSHFNSSSLTGEKGTYEGIVKLLEDAVNQSKKETKD